MESNKSLSSLSTVGKYYVYTLAYPDGRVFYVGKGRRGRINEHEREARKQRKEANTHKCNVIRRIWESGGQVLKTVLATFEAEQDAFLYEIALIFLMDGLTNLTDGGDGISGHIHSEETRRKLRTARKRQVSSEETIRKRAESNRGKTRTEETRRKLSEANRGKTHSEESRLKMSVWRKGTVLSEETRLKISEANRGKTRTEEHCYNLSVANKGKVRSEETRRKMREVNKGKVLSEETLRKRSLAQTGKTRSEETRLKMSEAQKRRAAQKREQALHAMREPITDPGNAEWKQGIAPLSLWD